MFASNTLLAHVTEYTWSQTRYGWNWASITHRLWITWPSYCSSLDPVWEWEFINVAVKLNGYCVDSDDDTLPWKIGEGLVGKTLDTYEPHLRRNIYELRRGKKLLSFLSIESRYNCLTLSLKSIHNSRLCVWVLNAPNTKLCRLVGVTIINTKHLVAKFQVCFWWKT